MNAVTLSGPNANSQWFAVDGGRIMGLPDRLRQLWPTELMPRPGGEARNRGGADDAHVGGARDAGAARDGRAAEPDRSRGDVAGIPDTVVLEEQPLAGTTRGLDVLTAWLSGFAAELNLTRTRLTIVISSATETAHLEMCLSDEAALAILVLRGEGFEPFAGYELLRRLHLQEIARVTEELGDLIDGDCVLTLSSLGESGDAELEFLHRTEGAWSRPRLERHDGKVTVSMDEDIGRAAVRTLIASVLTRVHGGRR